MAENGVKAPALAFVWDGSGFGTDGTVWGGETLLVDANSYRRIAHLRSFRLPGNETAVREPRRAAAGLVYEALGAAALDPEGPALGKAFRREEISILLTMLEKGLNSPLTSSAGRLFDGVASLLGLRQISGHEGQAAMELEFAAASGEAAEGYTISLETPPGEAAVLDWRRMIVEILADLRCGFAPAGIARRFHNTLAETIVKTALHVSSLWSSEGKLLPVLLTGGCFQNRLLTELAVERLRAEGFACYWHQRIPPNDGGISLGQAVAAARVIRRDQEFGGTDVSGDSGKAD
jgi:hydrogenase maturation protein HypF